MLENWVFMTAFLGWSLIALFHGCVLLFIPDRYLPAYSWGNPELKLARKPPFELGKRFFGLCLSGMILIVFVRPVAAWMLHPNGGKISGGASPSPRGVARWDMLGLALFALACGYWLLARPEKSVRAMFSTDRNRLEDKITLRLWTAYVQVSGLLFMLWFLIPMAEFIRSFRN